MTTRNAVSGGFQDAELRELRASFSRFATGVTIVGFQDEEGPAGLTVNAFTSVSLTPALLMVSIQKSSRSHAKLVGRPFSVSVLSFDQAATARGFAAKDRWGIPKWDETGFVPKVSDAIAWFECDPWQEHDAGDHTLLLGEIKKYGSNDGEPLLFYGGRMHSLAQLV